MRDTRNQDETVIHVIREFQSVPSVPSVCSWWLSAALLACWNACLIFGCWSCCGSYRRFVSFSPPFSLSPPWFTVFLFLFLFLFLFYYKYRLFRLLPAAHYRSDDGRRERMMATKTTTTTTTTSMLARKEVDRERTKDDRGRTQRIQERRRAGKWIIPPRTDKCRMGVFNLNPRPVVRFPLGCSWFFVLCSLFVAHSSWLVARARDW